MHAAELEVVAEVERAGLRGIGRGYQDSKKTEAILRGWGLRKPNAAYRLTH